MLYIKLLQISVTFCPLIQPNLLLAYDCHLTSMYMNETHVNLCSIKKIQLINDIVFDGNVSTTTDFFNTFDLPDWHDRIDFSNRLRLTILQITLIKREF